MELQHIIWSWETLIRRLQDAEPDLGRALTRSCRPIAAQRYRDGRLLVIVGCWWADDQAYLSRDTSRARLNSALGSMLTDQVAVQMARWPGGMASVSAPAAEEDIPAPDVLQGVPPELREEPAKCESAIQRLFFARAYARGLRLQCQHPLLHFRLDFAIPERRVATEVMGWDWRIGGSHAAERGDRQQYLEEQGWRILFFSGSQVLSDPDRCVSSLEQLAETPFGPRQQTLPTRFSPERRKPFSMIGTQRSPRPDRDGRRPGPNGRRPGT